MTTNEDIDESENKRTRTRSPAYPGIGLEDAINKAKVLWEKEHRHAVHESVVAKHWGYTSGGSQMLICVSAMLKYGLISAEGKAKERQIKLTEKAVEILLTDDIAKKVLAIKQVALSPDLNKDLWIKYGGSLPSDDSLKSILLIEKQFNPGAVGDYLKIFRDTISFAKLTQDDKLDEISGQLIISINKDDGKGGKNENYARFSNPPPKDKPETGAVMTEPFAFPLADGIAYLQVPKNMSEESYDMLVGYLKAAKAGLVRKIESKYSDQPSN